MTVLFINSMHLCFMDHITGDLPQREKTVRWGSVNVVKEKELCIHTVPDLLKSY